MKICHITTAHPRKDIRIFYKECISLVQKGMEVHLIVNDNHADELDHGVHIHSIKRKSQNRIKRIISKSVKIATYKKAIKLSADIYHFHDPELLSVGLKLKRNGYKVIYDSHEDVPRQIFVKEWIPKLIRPIISRIFEKYENKCSKEFNAIIATSPQIKARFLKINKNVFEVYNFPSIKDFVYSGDRYSVNNPAIYIGDLSRTRGILQIASATANSNTNLKLCGNFYSRGLQEELSSKFKNVNYLGYLSREEIKNELASSSVGLVTLMNTPNDYNSFPIKLFEYMAAGIPVIASNFPLYKQIVEENNCGICVDPNDTIAIEEAIRKIKTDYKYADQLRTNGRKAIMNKYNLENQVENLISCYSSVYNIV